MKHTLAWSRIIRWTLSLVLVFAGLGATWVWSRVARLAPPQTAESSSLPRVLYAAWQPAAGARPVLFRSADQGESWQVVPLGASIAAPVAFAGDESDLLAVALSDGTVLRSSDRGDHSKVVGTLSEVRSLAWDGSDTLYVSAGHGVFRQQAGDDLEALESLPAQLASFPVTHLAAFGGRLFVSTSSVMAYSDDQGQTWSAPVALPAALSALAAVDAQTLYAGTETGGVYRSVDAGKSWAPASAGLGQAAGLLVRISALQADAQLPGVVYAAVDYGVGGSQVHFTAAGTFVTLDGGGSWLPLAGPVFPQARTASAILPSPRESLRVTSVSAEGPQTYAPDLAAARAALGSSDALQRANAVRTLGLAKAQGAGDAALAALSDPAPGVSLAAAEALGRLADPSTTGRLLAALAHPDAQVQRGAIRALGLMRAEEAVVPLRARLLQGAPEMAGPAAEALGRIGSPAAVQALLAPLSDPQLSTRRHAALAGLEALGEPAVAPLLEMLDGAQAASRRNAAEALGWIGAPAAAEGLVRAMADGEPEVRAQAAWALGQVGGADAWEALARAQVNDASAEVRQTAHAGLVQIGPRPRPDATWVQAWAPALSRWQPVRWAIPLLALAGALWLVLGARRQAPVLVPEKARRR